jgi:hypothetical protein
MARNKLTLWQRFKAPVPPLLVRAQIFGASMVALGISLSTIPKIPVHLVAILTTGGSVLAAVCQFFVDQIKASKITKIE